MTFFFSFIWIYFFEFIQNIGSVLTVVLLVRYKQSPTNPRTWIYALIGSFLSAGAIKMTENYKLMRTTLVQETTGNTTGLILFSVVFALLALIAVAYFASPKGSKKSDMLVGVVMALALIVYEFYSFVTDGNSITLGRTISHSAAFLISFPVTMLLIREASMKKSLREVLWASGIAVVLMTALIVAFDYMPFVKW